MILQRQFGALGVLLLLGCGDSGQATSTGATSGAGGAGGSRGTGGDATSSTVNTTSASTASAGSGGSAPSAACAPLPAPNGNVIHAGPGDVANLKSIVSGAASGDTVLLEDGTYDLAGSWLPLSTDGVTLRSASGDPTKVILDGGYQTEEIVRVTASNVTVAEVTIQRPIHHAIHVTAEQGVDVVGTVIYGVHVIDPGEQGIKINGVSTTGPFTDTGTVACSTIRMTAGGRPKVNACYTGGIDAHESKGWRVHDNHIDGFWCDVGLSEHAIHFWSGSRDTLVERNVITNCARGVGFGLEETRPGRNYPDDPCPGISDAGHYNGVIRNNVIFAADPDLLASESGFDVGIGLEQACGTVVAHNTIVSSQEPFADIDIRFGKSSPVVANNLLSGKVKERNDGAAAALRGNIEDAPASLFVDPAQGDLHLLPTATQAIDKGETVQGVTVTDDVDTQPRDQKPDVGADELDSK